MVTTKVICNGKDLRIHRLSIEQKIDWHHQFEIAVEAESIEKRRALNIDKSIDLLGKSLEVEIKSSNKYSGNGLIFKGFITSIHVDRTYAEDDLIILKGYSYTYMLEDGLGCQSFEDLKGEEIFKKVTGNYPANILKTTASGNYSSAIPYMVRYKETNFQFLSRLAAMYGEWFYYNGQELIYGKAEDTNEVELRLGTDLQSYEYGVCMKPSNFEWLSYNYVENEQLKKSSSDYEPNELDKYGKDALAAAKDNFPGANKIPTQYDIKKESQLNERVEILKTSILSNTSTFKGQSRNPSLTIGTNAKIYGRGKAFINQFRITAVHHTVNAHSEYTNHFEAIPYECTYPPVNPNVIKPEAESQVAVVKTNEDDEKLGRIRVQFNWQSGDEMTPWIRIAKNYAGMSDDQGSYGFYFVPEEGDEVYVDFEHANPDRPYMVGAKYHGKVAPEWGAEPKDNNQKAIKTRSGHTILLNDEKGKESITISDKEGDSITIDTKEKTISISSKKDISISATSSISLSAEKITINASDSLEMSGATSASLSSATTSVSGSSEASLTSDANVVVNGKAKVAIDSNGEVIATGLAKSTLSSSGITSIEGTLVKLN